MDLVWSILLLILYLLILFYRPKDTPFDDGTFKLTMQFSEEYPNKPPTVRFVSKMFHPNGKSGIVYCCVDLYYIELCLSTISRSVSTQIVSQL